MIVWRHIGTRRRAVRKILLFTVGKNGGWSCVIVSECYIYARVCAPQSREREREREREHPPGTSNGVLVRSEVLVMGCCSVLIILRGFSVANIGKFFEMRIFFLGIFFRKKTPDSLTNQGLSGLNGANISIVSIVCKYFMLKNS